MDQLIIEGRKMPETLAEQYQCYDEDLGELLTMIPGNMVFEVRGTVKVISYYYEYFDDDLRKWCISNLRKGKEFVISYLDPSLDEMKTGRFMCTEPPRPKYYFSVDDRVFWTKFGFTLREVEPHD